MPGHVGFDWDVVILAGGRGSRLGGVRKADLAVGGRRLLDHVLDATDAARTRVVVGDADLVVPAGVVLTREDPPFAGPAAGLAAGLAAGVAAGVGVSSGAPAGAPWTMVLGCDLPGVGDAVQALLRSAGKAPGDVDALSASADPDDTERIEWVTAIIRTDVLRDAIAAVGSVGIVDCSMRRLLGRLRWRRVPVPRRATDDIDTWDDHRRWESETI